MNSPIALVSRRRCSRDAKSSVGSAGFDTGLGVAAAGAAVAAIAAGATDVTVGTGAAAAAAATEGDALCLAPSRAGADLGGILPAADPAVRDPAGPAAGESTDSTLAELTCAARAGTAATGTDPVAGGAEMLAGAEAIKLSQLAISGVTMLEVGREWPELKRLCLAHKLSDNDIPDAWIAAAIKTTGGHLATFDRGFRRFLSRGELTILDF